MPEPETISLVWRGLWVDLPKGHEALWQQATDHFGEQVFHNNASHEHGNQSGSVLLEMSFTEGKADDLTSPPQL